MRFDLEDKKKISLLCDLIRAVSNGRSNVVFVWHRTEGWAVLQNQEYLNNLDGSNLVNLCSIKPHFFSHVSPQNRDFVCFELDVSNLARVLKSTKKSIKRMVWHIFDSQQPADQLHTSFGAYNPQQNNNQSNVEHAELQINILTDEGQMEIRKDIFLNTRINAQGYFALFKQFREEKTQYLEIQQTHMKQMRELKRNECVFFRFADEFVTAYNHPDENNISIKKNALEKYDYPSLIQNLGGKNRLAIPPNFLVPQILIGLRLKDPIQLFMGDDIIDDNISVSLQTKTDSFTFISQFMSVMEFDQEDTRQNPFDLQLKTAAAASANPSAMHLHNRSSAVAAAPSHRQNIHYNKQQLVNQLQSNSGSQESHIQGLTNQMHLADHYQMNNTNNNRLLHSHNQFMQSYSSNDAEVDEHGGVVVVVDHHKVNMNFKKPIAQNYQQQQQQQQQQQSKFQLNRRNEDKNNETFNQGAQINSNINNNIYSLNSSQRSEGTASGPTFPWNGFNNKRRHELLQEATLGQDAAKSSVPFFADSINKRIKQSNYSEVHRSKSPPASNAIVNGRSTSPIHQQNLKAAAAYANDTSRQNNILNSFQNPLISQSDRGSENDFSSFISQQEKEDGFSIFKSNMNVPAIQFQPQGFQLNAKQIRKNINFI